MSTLVNVTEEITTEERECTVGVKNVLAFDVNEQRLYLFDGETYGGIGVGGGSQGPPGPKGDTGNAGPPGQIPSGFVFDGGKLYWTGYPIAPSIFIPTGKKLYVNSDTGEMVIQ